MKPQIQKWPKSINGAIITLLVILSAENSESKLTYFRKIAEAEYGSIPTMSYLNGVIYFGSGDGHLSSFSLNTGVQRTIANFSLSTSSKSVIFNDSVYIGSSNGVLYKYTPENDSLAVIPEVDSEIHGMTVFEDKIYYGSNKGFLSVFDPVTKENKNLTYVGRSVEQLTSSLSTVYIAAGYNVYAFSPDSEDYREAAYTAALVVDMSTSLNFKVYFGSDVHLYEYDILTDQYKIVCNTTLDFGISTVARLNNEIYIGSFVQGQIWTYDPLSGKCAKASAIRIGEIGINSMMTVNNRLYIGDYFGSIYEYYEEELLSILIVNENLKGIMDDRDSVILNELNLLNPLLDISVLFVDSKTETSAIIKAKEGNNKYYGEEEVYFYLLENEDRKEYDFADFVKKSVSVLFRKAYGFNVKEVNLTKYDVQFSDVVATKRDQAPITKTETTVCWNMTFKNDLDYAVNISTPVWNYALTNSITSKFSTLYTNTETTEERDPGTGWGYEMGSWPFDSFLCSGNVNDRNKPVTLTTTWDTAIESNPCVYMENMKEISEITVPPHEKLIVTASLVAESEEVTIDLMQYAGGTLVADVVTVFNEKDSLGGFFTDFMIPMKELDILPPGMTVNNDNTVTMNGEMIRTIRLEHEVTSNSNSQ